MDKNWDLLKIKALEFNINLTQDQLNLFKEYWNILDEYNSHTNLVSNTDQMTVIVKHFLDSLSIGLLKDSIDWDSDQTLIDIGIGGGFPGIPIIIANPNWKLCAVDSIGKKTKFIELLSERLGISDRVEVINSRAEDLARDGKRENFDIVVSRAVSQLNVLAEYCMPFVKKNGYFIAYKARDIDLEINQASKALKILGGKIENIKSYILPDSEDITRNLIAIKKESHTPIKYPRKSGIPKKQPL